MSRSFDKSGETLVIPNPGAGGTPTFQSVTNVGHVTATTIRVRNVESDGTTFGISNTNPTDTLSVGTTLVVKNDVNQMLLNGKLKIANSGHTDGGLLYSNAETVETVPGIVYNRATNKLTIGGTLEVQGGITGAGAGTSLTSGDANNMVIVDETSNVVGVSNVNYDFTTGKLKFNKGLTIRGTPLEKKITFEGTTSNVEISHSASNTLTITDTLGVGEANLSVDGRVGVKEIYFLA